MAADEKEGGVRATLNLGHTFGHAIETCTGACVCLPEGACGPCCLTAACLLRGTSNQL